MMQYASPPAPPQAAAVAEATEQPTAPTASWQPFSCEWTATSCEAEEEQTGATWLAEALWECYNT